MSLSNVTENQVNSSSEIYTYHLLKCSVEKFQKSYKDLSPGQVDIIDRRAERSFSLESLVLSSDEARDIMIPKEDIDYSIQQLITRYESYENFIEDLEKNNLNEEIMRQALLRELIFNAVMEKVASKSITTSDIDIRVFYELHRDQFTSPESRTARHILITINPEYEENTPEQAFFRINKLATKLKKKVNRFSAEAKKHSECPTALEGGALGTIQRGTLYPELDEVLFGMKQGEVSDVVESEIGFHILLCEKIIPPRTEPLSKVYQRIRSNLDTRKRRTCQKAWLKQLQQGVAD